MDGVMQTVQSFYRLSLIEMRLEEKFAFRFLK